MNFKEYISYLRTHKLKASFYVERSSDGHHPFQISHKFDIPNAKLIKENLHDSLTGDGDTSSFERLVTLDETGKLMLNNYQFIYHASSESLENVSWPDLSSAILSLPSVLLEKHFNKKEINDISEIEPSLLEKVSVTYQYNCGISSGNMYIGSIEIINEDLNKKLASIIAESVEGELVGCKEEEELAKVTVSYVGSEEINELYGNYTEIIEDTTDEKVDINDCFLNNLGLEFKLLESNQS